MTPFISKTNLIKGEGIEKEGKVDIIGADIENIIESSRL